MSGLVLQLGVAELYDAALELDAVAVLTDELMAGTAPAARWLAHQGPIIVVEDAGTGERCAMPAAALRAYRAAALTALAARQLLAAGVVTASVIGCGIAAQFQLLVIARHVPEVSHLAMCPLGDVEPRVIDQFDLAGIELTATRRVDDAVFGANLVALAGGDAGEPGVEYFAAGAVVINASDRDLPERLVNGVHQVYVDDLALSGSTAHRHVGHVEADLGQLVAGRHPGRTNPEHVLLVELLGARLLDLGFASRIHHMALRHHLGVLVQDPAQPTKGTSSVDQR